ncbi:hypothetical protein AQUCO_04900212v1 [Aquilegia coerulea]|uniref:Uncharacterized protein n=1 Tax=Aquilegia coerulea TaxID=218851 RepID=A0A2G5CKC2_AQUCA|nr:hypothetical protein AQUCO_04900212v1 [Aquilegia coerulea]
MAMTLLLCGRRSTIVSLTTNSALSNWVCNICSKSSREEESKSPTTTSSTPLRFSSLLQPSKDHLRDIKIELVDDESWKVSSGLTEAWRRQMNGFEERKSSMVEPVDETESFVENEPDFDDIMDMRFGGKLFYKIDRDSREFEEYNFDFHRKKTSKKSKEEPKEKGKKENVNLNTSSKDKESSKLAKVVKKNKAPDEVLDGSSDGKRLRTPTFNQLTAPYHEPFCLDIFISKSSVRACIIHRATSKVVVVAHSISKDMKFDLKSTKDDNACVAVGEILAQRALADDIHDIVYTPRKGDKVEGKLQIVLQSVIDRGVNVKVKIKQRKTKKVPFSSC